MFNNLVKIIKSPIFLFTDLQIGRVFRRLGLPVWTFVGIGISSLWFNNADVLIKLIVDKVAGKPVDRVSYISPLITFLIPCLVVWAISLWNKRSRNNRRLFSRLDNPDGKKCLIILASNEKSAKFAIDYHQNKGTLEKIFLIPSNDQDIKRFGASSLPMAEKIAEMSIINSPHLIIEVIRAGVSPAEAQDTFDIVNRIFRTSGYEPDEIIADFTGGTKPMAVGMIMACLPSQRELEYVSSRYIPGNPNLRNTLPICRSANKNLIGRVIILINFVCMVYMFGTKVQLNT